MIDKFDITKHRFSDSDIEDADYYCDGDPELQITLDCGWPETATITFNKDDAIVIAKHFYDQMDNNEKGHFFEKIITDGEQTHSGDTARELDTGCELNSIPQSETTIKHHTGDDSEEHF